MIAYLILGIALLAGGLLAGRWYVNADPKSILRALKWLLVLVVLGVILFFALTGRLVWAIMAVPALLPWFFRIRQAAQSARYYQNAGQSSGNGAKSRGSGTMSREEALAILGLDETANAEQIHEAHRRLIANLHPDKGGSDYLAAQINQAKDVLLG